MEPIQRSMKAFRRPRCGGLHSDTGVFKGRVEAPAIFEVFVPDEMTYG
jgi:hypothetical protein